MKKLLVLITMVLLGCQKDGVGYRAIPTPTLAVKDITAHSAMLTATLLGDSCVRGFLISKYNIPDLTRPDNEILWCPYGIGDYQLQVKLVHRGSYFVVAFAYWRGQADRVGYSEVVGFKAE